MIRGMRANWFIALPVSPSPWFTPLMATLPASCRAFSPSDLHMTVAFLGGIDAERAPCLTALLEQVDASPLTACPGPLLALPSPQKCSALSLSLHEGRDEAVQLIARWRDLFHDAAGVARDLRPPLPHITVARPIRKFGAEGRQAAATWYQQLVVPHITLNLNRIALYTWAEDRPIHQFRIVAEKCFG